MIVRDQLDPVGFFYGSNTLYRQDKDGHLHYLCAGCEDWHFACLAEYYQPMLRRKLTFADWRAMHAQYSSDVWRRLVWEVMPPDVQAQFLTPTESQ